MGCWEVFVVCWRGIRYGLRLGTDIHLIHSPGRFFAANELKIILACVVLRYDVKFEDEGKRPDNEWLAYACYPARRAHVLFRRRQAASI